MGQYSQACKLKQEGKSLASLKEADTPDQEAEEEDMECEDSEAAGEATHWSQLDTKSMKVADLRTELNARGQPSKGVKLQLAAKLQACLDEEKVKEESKDKAEEEENTSEKNDENETPAEESSNTDGEPKEETAEEITIVLDDRQKEKLASAYKTPTNPCIFVHPDSKAKSGKFDCRVESLSVLLDYRTDDNKEGMFEVSLFAELFNEMMTRDSAFTLYKALANAKEKPKEKEKKEEKKESKPETEETNKAH